MALKAKLFGHSSVYVLGSFFEQGVGMILLPLYLRVLTPEEYGIVGYCRSISGFVSIVLGLGLHAAAGRLYFQYRDEPKELKEFWGTLFVSLLLFSVGLGTLLSFFGGPIFRPILGEIAFYPFVTLALLTASAGPFINTYLRILQTRHQSITFTILNSTRFLASMCLIVYLVAFRKMGASGPLLGHTIITTFYLLISVLLVLKDITLCFKWKYFCEAIAYSIPILPAALAGRLSVIADRVILNKKIGADQVGLYQAGYQLGYPLSVVGIAINSAFSPIFQDAMKTEDNEKLREIKRIGLFLVYGYCLLGAALAFYAREIMWVVSGEDFLASTQVVPFIAFYYSLTGIYYLFVSPLQYFRHTLWYGFIIASMGMGLNIVLNLLLIPIPWLGMVGAAISALSTQILVTVVTAVIADRYTRVDWQYGRYAMMSTVAIAVGIGINFIPLEVGFGVLILKLLALAALCFLLSLIGWGDPLYILRRGGQEWSRLMDKRWKATGDQGEPSTVDDEFE